MNVVCSIVILFSNGYRDPQDVRGIVVKERGDYYIVDFSQEFSERKVDLSLQTAVQRINANSCLTQE